MDVDEVIEIDNNNVFTQCPCCGGSSFRGLGNLILPLRTIFSTIDIKLLNLPYLEECKACETSFVQNSMRSQDAEKLYSTGDGRKRWSGTTFIKDKTVVVVERLQSLIQLKANQTVCDIGCNTGEFLDFAKPMGAKTFGVELSTASVDFCLKAGHSVKPDLNAFDDTFDIITAFDLIEHLYSPDTFFKDVFRKLNKDGFLVLFTGNNHCLPARLLRSKWWYVNYPEHVVFPSRKYYESLSDYHLVTYTKTYASRTHERSSKLINSLKLFGGGSYSGRGSFPDHHLVVLQRNK